MVYLLDTCVLSEPLKRTPDKGVLRWMDAQDEPLLYVSVLTLGELRKGIVKLNDPRRREKLERWVEVDLAGRFQGRVLAVTERVAVLWGGICGEAEKRSEPLPVIDSLIGATAIAHSLTVATRNTADISRTGARVFNPWH
ncbi:MAG: type II toxin-antitoxin system VapC family toxin [Planctomycetes bacterium]|nr:type II toxin-antitoxin system VapC family toxin [Planctomycetota bacterium]